jgi:hypothetical protein
VALPYYRNIGLLIVQKHALDEHLVEKKTLQSWPNLQKAAMRRPGLFDFSRRSDENFNCLFLEMILGLGKQQFPSIEGGFEALRAWVLSEAFEEALCCFQTVCAERPKNVAPAGRSEGSPSPPLITRQWYTNLSPPKTEEAQYEVFALPGKVAISGEWYLGVWAHSAVPDIGFRLILDELTSRRGEFLRLQEGIGLPVRRKFYGKGLAKFFFPDEIEVSPELDLRKLVESAARRSGIYQYHLFAPVLSRHLHALLGPHKPSPKQIAKRLADTAKVVLEG